MPENIISQFNRAYNEPIETNRRVSTIGERNSIPTGVRWLGMLVFVSSDNNTYVLKNTTDNTGWEVITGLSDAPEDGESYVRKDGAWEIAPAGAVASSGTFTPVISNLSGGGSFTVTASTGYWYSIGNLFFVNILLEGVNSVGTTNNVRVSGFPATSLVAAEDILFPVGLIKGANISGAISYGLRAILLPNTNYFSFKYQNGTTPQGIDFTDGNMQINATFIKQ